MRVIGLTGGVGSGKSQIAGLLARYDGVGVVQTDQAAHELMEPGAAGYQRLLETFGASLLGEDGAVDRGKMAEFIFHDSAARRAVNELIHPLVWQEVERRIRCFGGKLLFVESAVPDEKFRDICDEIWYVYTSEENRRSRLSAGRGYSEEKSESIMASQPEESRFRELADQIIDNNGSLEDVRNQLDALLSAGGAAET